MASVQNLETRLNVVEEKVDWLLRQFKVEKRSLGATVGPDGRPSVRIETQDLLQVYRDLKNGTVEEVKNVSE